MAADTIMRATVALLLAVTMAGCTASVPPIPPPPPPPPIDLWSADRLDLSPEADLAAIRRYAHANGFRYTRHQERLGLLQQFDRRARARLFRGYVQIWGDGATYHVNVKPPYDRAALLRLASPALRSLLVIHEVYTDEAQIAALRQVLAAKLATIPGVEFVYDFDVRKARFDVTIVGTDNASRLRMLLPPELSRITDINVGTSPLVVF
jgi:hypothetical protein